MKKIVLVCLVLIFALCAFFVFHEKVFAEENNTQIIDGSCVVQSYVAEGQVGEDVTKRKRFHCDSAIITLSGDRMMVTFVDKKSSRNDLIAFAGKVSLRDDGGRDLYPDKIYLKPGIPISLSGYQVCTLEYSKGENESPNVIRCTVNTGNSNNERLYTTVHVDFYTGLHDDSSTVEERYTMADYPDAKDAHDAFDKCLVQSLKKDDNWFTRQQKCGGIGQVWCTEQGLPTLIEATLMEPDSSGQMDMRCMNGTNREETSVVSQYGDQRQKMEWEAAGGERRQ